MNLKGAHARAGLLAGLATHGGLALEQAVPKNGIQWEGPTLEQFVKSYSPWEGLILEKFMEECSHGKDPTLEQGNKFSP